MQKLDVHAELGTTHAWSENNQDGLNNEAISGMQHNLKWLLAMVKALYETEEST